MMSESSACIALVFDLLQDVNILWPVAELAAEETRLPILLLVSERFRARDTDGKWQAELSELMHRTGAALHVFGSPFEAYSLLMSRRGVIFAGSESNLNAHVTSHSLFKSAPAGFVRITLQHGYECVGFLQNREQSMVFGEDIQFAADIVCSWMPHDRLNHLRPSEQAKLFVAGPSALIARNAVGLAPDAARGETGIVCENLHSVRMNAAGDFKSSYMDTFRGFAEDMAKKGRAVALRPHPGGQYVVRNAVTLPPNMALANEPMYRTDLSQYAYGISAPSSVLIDMVLAGIPTAVWQDEGAVIDAGNYAGLERVSSREDWLRFAEAAIADPSHFVDRQRAFLASTGIVDDRTTVRRRFLDLLRIAEPPTVDPASARRVMFIANADIPTLQLGFFKPLNHLIDAGLIRAKLVTEADLRRKMGKAGNEDAAWQWFATEIDAYQPDLAVFCRYSGPLVDQAIDKLTQHEVPIIFHIDDDLLNVPVEIGEAKFKEHNRPERRSTVTTLLNRADLVYCSTDLLLKRFEALGFAGNMRSGGIYCSAHVLAEAVNRPVRKIGYMGFDHAHDLELALPDLVQFLRERPEIEFELFGSIPKPATLDEFGDRIIVTPPVRPYEAFLDHFATLGWDIGICPLADTEFNVVKANTKWVEYTSVGAAVIATSGMAYDECCSQNCGILLEGMTGLRDALHALCDDPERRYTMVAAAQERIRREYAVENLRDQVLDMFDHAQVASSHSARTIQI